MVDDDDVGLRRRAGACGDEAVAGNAGTRRRCSSRSSRRCRARTAGPRAGPRSRRGRRSRCASTTRRCTSNVDALSSRDRISRTPSSKRVEAVQAEVVAAPFHVGRGERHAERVPQDRQILEVDLLLEVLGAGRDEHALAAEDRRDRGTRASCPCRCRLRRAARRRRRRRPRTASAISSCAGARLEPVERAARAARRARTRRRRRPLSACALGVQRELPAQGLDFCLHRRERGVVVRVTRARARSARAMTSISGSRMPRLVIAGVPMRMPLATIGGFLIERDRVLVDRDAGLAERRFGDLAGEAPARRRPPASGDCRCRR